MKVRLEEEIDKNKEAVMFISRNHNTLQDAIKQILDSDIFPDEIKNNQIKRLKEIPQIKIYNEHSDSAIIAFNYLDIFPQDLAIYLDKYNICVRAGSHCAKMLKEELEIKNTCRISLYFYNTKEEIDYLIKVLQNPNIKNELF